VQISASLS